MIGLLVVMSIVVLLVVLLFNFLVAGEGVPDHLLLLSVIDGLHLIFVLQV